MKILFCDYHYEKSKHPKFYNSACKLLEKAKYCAFINQNEIDIFVSLCRKALEENTPEGHPSKVLHSKNANGGQITIWTGNLDDDVARLYYKPISRFLEYDSEVNDFFDVSEQYEKGGAL